MREGRYTTQSMVYCQKSGLRELGARECCWSPSYPSSVLVLSPCRSEISLISHCRINTVFLVSICPALFPAGCWHNSREGTSWFEMAQTDWYLPSMLEKRQWTILSQNYQILAVEDNVGQKFKLPFQQLNFHYCIILPVQLHMLAPLLWSNLCIYISISASTELTAMLLSTTSLLRSMKADSSLLRVLMFCKITLFQLTTPLSLSKAWLLNCMPVRSVLLHEGVRTSSHKTIHMKKPPNSSPRSSPHSSALHSFQSGEFCISLQNPSKAKIFICLRIVQIIHLQTQAMNSCLLLIVWGNSNS